MFSNDWTAQGAHGESCYSAADDKNQDFFGLAVLNAAEKESDMNLPGWDWHALKGQLAGRWSVSVSGNWRLTYAFEDGDAILIDF
jgi:plasmid maintenance system killer protein